jgi:hypothetical protein
LRLIFFVFFFWLDEGINWAWLLSLMRVFYYDLKLRVEDVVVALEVRALSKGLS